MPGIHAFTLHELPRPGRTRLAEAQLEQSEFIIAKMERPAATKKKQR